MTDTAARQGPEPRIVLAAVVGAHGVKGEVRLKLFAEDVESVRRHRVLIADGRPLTLLSIKGEGTAVARFAEITDRNAAEALRGAQLTVARSELPPLKDDEYYHADLIGLPCESPDGTLLGTVKAVQNFGAGDILEIEKTDGKLGMAPLKPGVAEIGEGKIVVDPLFLA